MTPATSPSVISRMRAPALRTAAISSWWRGRSRIRTTRSSIGEALGLGQPGEIHGRRVAQLDDARRQAGADGDLVHVGVGRVEEAAMRRHGDAGDGVGPALGADRGALERIEGDVDLGPAAGADLLADVEHRRLVALALADHDRAVDVEHVQRLAHGVDGGLVGGLLVAVADQPGAGQGPRPRSRGRCPGRGCGPR